MKKLCVIAFFLLVGLAAFYATPATPAKKSILNAADYGMIPGCTDAGVCLNNLWADAANNCVIHLPPGSWDIQTPIVWTGKRFSCLAEQTGLTWRGGNQTVLTVGADPKRGDAGNSVQSCYIAGLQMGAPSVISGTGLRIQNANKCVFDRMVFCNFTVGILHWSDQIQGGYDYYSYFNAVRDCEFYSCTTCIKTDGDPQRGYDENHNPIGSPQSHDMRITGFDGAGVIQTFFDFDVSGGNYVQASSCQSNCENPFILKAGSGSNQLSVKYFEAPGTGPNPWKGTIRLNSDGNVIYFPYSAGHLIVEDTGKNNTLIDPMFKTMVLEH